MHFTQESQAMPHSYILIFYRFIADPFIDGIRSELDVLEKKKQEQMDKSLAEKAAKGKWIVILFHNQTMPQFLFGP